MYKLTDIMLQTFEKDLRKFHELFQGGRCQSWQLEELLAKAIRSDFNKSDKVVWKGNGHDIGADIIVNDKYNIQIKSGKIDKKYLTLSGHRLGRFGGDLEKITEFLNANTYDLIAVPHETQEGTYGKKHVYQLFYINTDILKIECYTRWKKKKNNHHSINDGGVELIIYPSMSWQVWWKVPLIKLESGSTTRPMIIT